MSPSPDMFSSSMRKVNVNTAVDMALANVLRH